MADDVAVVARRGERPLSETVLADQNPQAMMTVGSSHSGFTRGFGEDKSPSNLLARPDNSICRSERWKKCFAREESKKKSRNFFSGRAPCTVHSDVKRRMRRRRPKKYPNMRKTVWAGLARKKFFFLLFLCFEKRKGAKSSLLDALEPLLSPSAINYS